MFELPVEEDIPMEKRKPTKKKKKKKQQGNNDESSPSPYDEDNALNRNRENDDGNESENQNGFRLNVVNLSLPNKLLARCNLKLTFRGCHGDGGDLHHYLFSLEKRFDTGDRKEN